MKIIISRKGLDSSNGGASPIFCDDDGRMVSVPIPADNSCIKYSDIHWQSEVGDNNLGNVVKQLSDCSIKSIYKSVKSDGLTHLDPDLRCDALKNRAINWRPLFGQADAAQAHLHNQGVGRGDLFLFFGRFSPIEGSKERYKWKEESKHVIWGWLQIDEVLTIGNEVSADIKSKYPWAMCHPHFSHPQRGEKNTVYIAREKLSLNGDTDLPGAGVFTHFSEDLQLTDPEQKRRSVWKLPKWFYPDNGKKPLTYHDNMDRWEKKNGCAQLQSVSHRARICAGL